MPLRLFPKYERATKDEMALIEKYILKGYSDKYIAFLFDKDRTTVLNRRRKIFNKTQSEMTIGGVAKEMDLHELAIACQEIQKTKRTFYKGNEYMDLILARLRKRKTHIMSLQEKGALPIKEVEEVKKPIEPVYNLQQHTKVVPATRPPKSYKEYIKIAAEKAHPKFRSMYTTKRHNFSEVTVLA